MFRKITLLNIFLILTIIPAGNAFAALSTIDVNPAYPILNLGETLSFTASGTNDDGSPATLLASMISVNYDHSCAMSGDGRVQCWGYNGTGQLGNGTVNNSVIPVPVSGITNASAISAGYQHNCALLADGTVQCWGYNNYGQLGNGTTDNSSIPVTVAGISNAVQVSSGMSQSCALLADGTVQCWGRTYGDMTSSTTPVSIAGINTATAISTGNGNGCALLADGTVQCWGYNNHGQLGNGTNDTSITPVPVSGITAAVSISSGMSSHSCAVLADGTIKCWGYNVNGQLGNGTQASSNVPTPVTGINTARLVVGGEGNSCAVLVDNTVQCWGNNYHGQLGNGTKNSSTTPVPMTGINSATMVSIGRLHSCIRLSDGSVQCMGHNVRGQLGNDLPETSLPVPVTGFPDGLFWSSSNPAVAAIDASGVATAFSAGTTIIMATSGMITGSTILTVQSITFNLTITTSGTGSGTVIGGGTYDYGTTASVSAIPDAGSILKGWIGPDGEECATGSVLMTADKSCNAIFHIPTPPPACEPLPNKYEFVGDLDDVTGFSRLAMGPSGNLYVSDYNGHAIHVYNQGQLIKSISVSYPRAVDVSDSGEIFVATGTSIKGFIINPDDTVTERVAVANATYYDTNGLAVSADGRFFVYDGVMTLAQVYASDGTFIQYLGQSIINNPRGITIDDANRRILVSQYGTSEVLIFDLDDYSLVDRFGSLRTDGLAEGLYFDFISGVETDKAGRIYIADQTGEVYFADACYNYLDRIGGYYVWNDVLKISELVKGRYDGRLDFPLDVAIDNSGIMYVSELNGRIAMFTNNSSVKRTIVGRGTDTIDRIESYDADGVGTLPFTSYSSTGTAHVAAGDINGDGISEIMTVPGASNPSLPELKVFNQDGTEWLTLRTLPFGSASVTDMGVTSADFNNDGQDEVVVWSGGSGQPLALKVYSYDAVTGSLLESGIDLLYNGGNSLLRVAAGDVNGDGKKDLITLAGKLSNGGATRRWTFQIWNVNTDSGLGSWSVKKQNQFTHVMESRFAISLTTGNVDDDTADEMPVAVWDNTVPDSAVTVYFFEGTGSLAGEFNAGVTDTLGASIASANMDGLDRDELLLMLHDETGDLGVVKVLRTDGKVMNTFDVSSPRSGFSIAIGEFPAP